MTDKPTLRITKVENLKEVDGNVVVDDPTKPFSWQTNFVSWGNPRTDKPKSPVEEAAETWINNKYGGRMKLKKYYFVVDQEDGLLVPSQDEPQYNEVHTNLESCKEDCDYLEGYRGEPDKIEARYILTEEELKEVYEAGAYENKCGGENCPTYLRFTSFEDWLKEQEK